MDGKEVKPYKTKAELVRTVAAVVQLSITVATLVILIVVHFL